MPSDAKLLATAGARLYPNVLKPEKAAAQCTDTLTSEQTRSVPQDVNSSASVLSPLPALQPHRQTVLLYIEIRLSTTRNVRLDAFTSVVKRRSNVPSQTRLIRIVSPHTRSIRQSMERSVQSAVSVYLTFQLPH